MTKFVVYSCMPSKRAVGKFTLWGKLVRKIGKVTITSPLFWIRSDEAEIKWAELDIPDNHKLVAETVGDRVFTHIELT